MRKQRCFKTLLRSGPRGTSLVLVMTTKTTKLPRLPAKARNAGATSVVRCMRSNLFSVGYRLDGSDCDAPGCGQAVVDSLRDHYGARADIRWNGKQGGQIIIEIL